MASVETNELAVGDGDPKQAGSLNDRGQTWTCARRGEPVHPWREPELVEEVAEGVIVCRPAGARGHDIAHLVPLADDVITTTKSLHISNYNDAMGRWIVVDATEEEGNWMVAAPTTKKMGPHFACLHPFSSRGLATRFVATLIGVGG